MSARRRAVGALLAAAALTACSPSGAGSAVVVGDQRVSNEEVRTVADRLVSAEQSPFAQERPRAVSYTLNYLTEYALLDELAARQDPPITVDQSEIEAIRGQLVRTGGEEGLASAFLEQGVAPGTEDRYLRWYLIQTELGERLVPGTATEQVQVERQQAVNAFRRQFAESIGVEISPRYGRYDAVNATLVPLESGGLATGSTPTPAPGLTGEGTG
ncbi:hypothetical protein [Motilibacter aurantiacus]|uniref:hypothetical protein n=1 Tax=Motilibacter aurantiacus TaxID=2714955 RepID=UPI0014096705|nr:hypothetical protein [Motilibacter aurantiacus]NHC45852.1 hypothetical protein [Motilibacter aurantiacus]